LILLLVAAAAVLSASLGGALAYFTANETALGQRELSIKAPSTHVEEKVVSGTKHITVVNDKDSDPVLVRVRAFCGQEYELEYSSQSDSWKRQGDYWVYDQVLEPESTTDELLVHIKELPAASRGGEHFNIVVTEETSQVFYTADGVPYAVWEQEGGQG
jgi:predicted ribosomally synthesized peptide with SipW-like signal peptide